MKTKQHLQLWHEHFRHEDLHDDWRDMLDDLVLGIDKFGLASDEFGLIAHLGELSLDETWEPTDCQKEQIAEMWTNSVVGK